MKPAGQLIATSLEGPDDWEGAQRLIAGAKALIAG